MYAIRSYYAIASLETTLFLSPDLLKSIAKQLPDGTFGADRFDPLLLKLLLRKFPDHRRHDGAASCQPVGDCLKLGLPEGMVRVVGTVLLDGDFVDQVDGLGRDLVDEKAFGVAEVLVDVRPSYNFV